ncbi:MAG: TonB-dependent receptor plug domain-containing protein, partial [bacterium]
MKTFLKAARAIIFLMLLSEKAAGQNRVAHLTGRVLDRTTDLPIAGVMLRLRETNVQIESDSAGSFNLPLPPGKSVMIAARRLGYHVYQRHLPATTTSDTLKITLALWPNPLVFPEVIVEKEQAHRAEPLQSSRTSEVALRQPGAFEDPLRALQQLPGVTLRSDWDSQISVRGATPDQTLVVIDGFILPNPYRLQFALGGGMSLVNLGILRSAGLWKSGFSPRFGDRLAGLIVFETKSALQKKSRELRLNAFDAGLNLALPVKTNRTGVLVAGRRNYHDAFEKLAPLNDFAVPRWQDVQIKATHQFSPRHQAEVLFIGSKEWAHLRLGDLTQGRIDERAGTLFAGVLHRWALAPDRIWE